MTFSAATYRDAAAERMRLAVELYQLGHYDFSIYTAGLAVECILRAYRVAFDAEFDARHVLPELYRQSRFAESVGPAKVTEIGRAIGTVAAIWRNDHRFRSEEALRKFLSRQRLYYGIKGDVLKENARRTVNEATIVVNHGVSRWTSLQNDS